MAYTGNMIKLTKQTANEMNMDLARRQAALRKRRKLSQKELAAKAGVSLGSLKRFEQTGEISLQSLTKLAIALEAEEAIQQLFADIPPQSIEEVVRGQD